MECNCKQTVDVLVQDNFYLKSIIDRLLEAQKMEKDTTAPSTARAYVGDQDGVDYIDDEGEDD